jgi:uncharacterized protein YpiB (UPF0302 family)
MKKSLVFGGNKPAMERKSSYPVKNFLDWALFEHQLKREEVKIVS